MRVQSAAVRILLSLSILGIPACGVPPDDAETPLADPGVEVADATRTEPAASLEDTIHVLSTTGDLLAHRVCLEDGGTHVVEAEARSTANSATGILSVEDGSEDGEFVTMAMRVADKSLTVRSEPVDLHAGEPCFLLSVQTGVYGKGRRNINFP